MFSALSHRPLTIRTGNPPAVQLKLAAAGIAMTLGLSKLNRRVTTQRELEMAPGREPS